MSEIVEDLKLANLEINDSLGLTLSSLNSRVSHTGTGDLEILSNGDCTVSSAVNLTLTCGGDVNLVTRNNTKKVNICNSTNSLSFFGLTGIDQFNTTNKETGLGTTPVVLNTTFTGGVGTATYQIDDIVKALKQYGLLATNTSA
jgi:hypothetical protein